MHEVAKWKRRKIISLFAQGVDIPAIVSEVGVQYHEVRFILAEHKRFTPKINPGKGKRR